MIGLIMRIEDLQPLHHGGRKLTHEHTISQFFSPYISLKPQPPLFFSLSSNLKLVHTRLGCANRAPTLI